MNQQPGQQANQSPAWRVTGQREVNRVNDSGQYVSGVAVTFQTRSGTVATVFIPDAQYSPENAKNLIATRAAQIESVSGLTG